MPVRLLLSVLLTAAATTVVAAADCRVADPELQGFYEGGCRNGLAHGVGTARGSAEYTGGFRKGLKHGHGVKTWAWGDRYEGGFADDRKQGAGTYVWGAGSPWAGERFVGEYVADQREGQGSYFWLNGDRFDGQWKADRRYGYSAMEQRRQVAEAARTEVLVPGTQVCARGEAGTAQQLLRVGKIEAVVEQGLEVRLTHVEGEGTAAGPRAGSVILSAAGDWMPCL